MTKEELKQYIDENVYENQDGEITGESLNAVLKAIVDDGGTEVVANPTGEATTPLNKIKIGETIYKTDNPFVGEVQATDAERLQALANVSNQEVGYDSSEPPVFTGKMGYVVLQPEKAGDATTTFAAQIANKPNTIFEVRDVYNLDPNEVTDKKTLSSISDYLHIGGYWYYYNNNITIQLEPSKSPSSKMVLLKAVGINNCFLSNNKSSSILPNTAIIEDEQMYPAIRESDAASCKVGDEDSVTIHLTDIVVINEETYFKYITGINLTSGQEITASGCVILDDSDEILGTGNYEAEDDTTVFIARKAKTFTATSFKITPYCEIPANCTLKFNGGMIKNGTLNGDNTVIDTSEESFDNVTFTGIYNLDSISPNIFVGSDTKKLQTAFDLSECANYSQVRLSRAYHITDTITKVHNLFMNGKGSIIIDADVDGLVVQDDYAVIQGGTISVESGVSTVGDYTKNTIVMNGPLAHVTIKDLAIIGRAWNSVSSGTAIDINTSPNKGRHFAHTITNVKICYFQKGIDIDALYSWSNNFVIDIVSYYVSITIDMLNIPHDSDGHYIRVRGQAPLLSQAGPDGCVVRNHKGESWSTYDIGMYDIGDSGNISKKMDVRAGIIKDFHDSYLGCVQSGTWIQNNEPEFDVLSSCINGCDGGSVNWVTKEAVGNATDVIGSSDIMSLGETSRNSTRLAQVYADTDGVKYTINFPTPIIIDKIFLDAWVNYEPVKIIITATGNNGYAPESVEIAGKRCSYGKALRASDLFSWKSYMKCAKLEIQVLGAYGSDYNGDTYTYFKYFGVSAVKGEKFMGDNYSLMENKPKINNVILDGNLNSEQLELISKEQYEELRSLIMASLDSDTSLIYLDENNDLHTVQNYTADETTGMDFQTNYPNAKKILSLGTISSKATVKSYIGGSENTSNSITEEINITIPAYVYSLYAGFYNSSVLEKAIIRTKKTVTVATALFQLCSKLKYIDMRGFHMSGTTNISNFAYNCPKLEYVSFNGCDFSKVTDVAQAFAFSFHSSADEYGTIDFTGCDFSRVSNATLMFHHSFKLRNLIAGVEGTLKCSINLADTAISANVESIVSVINWLYDFISNPPSEYDENSSYSIGDLVVYNDETYINKTTISSGEAWDSSHWVKTSKTLTLSNNAKNAYNNVYGENAIQTAVAAKGWTLA